ncbi:MAG: DoxX family membrane protein [Rikenellaceae bacterium]|jgi:thiosulfate dehydrogenase [quinone] large subunit|nr:DoxX family membrane protein [Rikenellaceae bacterium]
MNYSTKQLTALVCLRVAIGWHFAYEGLVKIFNPTWGSAMYLKDSQGWFSDLFNSLADQAQAMEVVNTLNEWGLLLIGLGLICGAFVKIASWSGVLLLVFYYLSHPAFPGVSYAMPMEGAYLWVDKNIVEALALVVVIYLPTSHIIGLDRLLKKYLPKLV